MLNCQALIEKLPHTNHLIQVILSSKLILKKVIHKITSLFQRMEKHFIKIAGVGNSSYIYYWKSRGLCHKIINPIKTSNHGITPNLSY